MRKLKKLRLLFDGLVDREKSRRLIKASQKGYGSSFEVFHEGPDDNMIAKLCDFYGSDKGQISNTGHPYAWESHNYADFYQFIFHPFLHEAFNLLECGIGTNNPRLKSNMGINGNPGASLRVWRDYFTSAEIYGVDVDREVLFSEARIQTFYCDQTSKESIKEFINEAKIRRHFFKVIIDDGLHEFRAGISFFEGVCEYLDPNGFYIIEDVKRSDKRRYIDYFENFEKRFNYVIVDLYRRQKLLGDNSLIVLTPKHIGSN